MLEVVLSEHSDKDSCDIVEEYHINAENVQPSNETFYKCGICGHRTTTATLLKVHMKIHTVKRIHQCNICNEIFKCVTDLNSHILTHTEEERSFKCDVCARYCFTKEDLDKHYRVHTKENALKCPLCSRTFSADGHLKCHIRSQHGTDQLKSIMKKDGKYVDPSLILNSIHNINEEGPGVFECDVCLKKFSKEEFLDVHLESHLNQQEFYHGVFETKEFLPETVACMDISKDYIKNCKTIITVEVDLSLEKNGKQHHLCQLCKAEFIDNSELFSHMVEVHGYSAQSDLGNDTTKLQMKKTVFQCKICSRNFPSPSKLKTHMRTHSGEKPFKCEICTKSYAFIGSLKTHSYAHTNNKPFKCTMCDKSYITNRELEIHVRSHTGEKPYECNVCKKRFASSAKLTEHFHCHDKVKMFMCDVCNKSFCHLRILKEHLITHTGSKLYACNLCEKSYYCKSSLRSHIKKHTEEKTYKCRFCEKEWTRRIDLKIHERIHTGEKPYVCNICDKSFTQSGTLNQHLNSHKGLKPYPCTICSKGFTSAAYLKAHNKKVHGPEQFKYQCKDCEETFKYMKDYQCHLKKHKSKTNNQTAKQLYIPLKQLHINENRAEPTSALKVERVEAKQLYIPLKRLYINEA